MSALTVILVVMYWQAVVGVLGAAGNFLLGGSPRLSKVLNYNLILLWFVILPTLLEQLA